MPTPASPYVGRFAPSPTGPLHFGSLVAALGSCLDARAAGGRWLLRIEDVDAPRTVAGAADDILRTLVRLGFEWDDEPLWQSRRLDCYAEVLAQLRERGKAFACACTRREIADSALARDGSRIYPGTCRNGLPPGREARAWRLRVCGQVHFEDRVQGPQCEDLEREVGDFVLLRADGQYAYQLAVVVDDVDCGVTDVVRGADLLASTGRQVHLLHTLGQPVPRYAHLPVAVDAAGDKLSKQTLAAPVSDWPPAAALVAALRFLGQNVPESLARAGLAEVWQWAVAHWRMDAVPRVRQAPAPLTSTAPR